LTSWLPSERAKALSAPVDVDASKLEAGQVLKVVWRGQPVFIVRRAKSVLDQLGAMTICWPTLNRRTRCSRITSRARRGGESGILGGSRGLHSPGLLAAGAFEPNNATQLAGTDLGQGCRADSTARATIEIRHLRRVFKGMPARRTSRFFVHDLGGCAHFDRRGQRPQESLIENEGKSDGRST